MYFKQGSKIMSIQLQWCNKLQSEAAFPKSAVPAYYSIQYPASAFCISIALCTPASAIVIWISAYADSSTLKESRGHAQPPEAEKAERGVDSIGGVVRDAEMARQIIFSSICVFSSLVETKGGHDLSGRKVLRWKYCTRVRWDDPPPSSSSHQYLRRVCVCVTRRGNDVGNLVLHGFYFSLVSFFTTVAWYSLVSLVIC